ncbi:hypothetical protein BRADI_5g03081v3 [Brachypodium distachyon]|uniref:Uncharacterized protein n=1 Tax=Brachypodium distachyon TaxID=15368 RepID=A0A2K2CF55_BRADI|nr:hypothetical protein BRADI_5g03081v3 [Brachypodium distachyon]
MTQYHPQILNMEAKTKVKSHMPSQIMQSIQRGHPRILKRMQRCSPKFRLAAQMSIGTYYFFSALCIYNSAALINLSGI